MDGSRKVTISKGVSFDERLQTSMNKIGKNERWVNLEAPELKSDYLSTHETNQRPNGSVEMTVQDQPASMDGADNKHDEANDKSPSEELRDGDYLQDLLDLVTYYPDLTHIFRCTADDPPKRIEYKMAVDGKVVKG